MSEQLRLVSLTASALHCWGVGSGFEGSQGYHDAVEEILYLRVPQSLPRHCAQGVMTDIEPLQALSMINIFRASLPDKEGGTMNVAGLV